MDNDNQRLAAATHYLKKRWDNPLNREGVQEGIDYFFEEFNNLALMEIEARENAGKPSTNEFGDYIIGTDPTIDLTLPGPVVHTLPSGINAIGQSFNSKGLTVKPLGQEPLEQYADGGIQENDPSMPVHVPYEELQNSTLRLIYRQILELPE